MIQKIFKRKYEKKLLNRALDIQENRDFLINRMKQEWEIIERTIAKDRKKEKLYEIARKTGTVLGLTVLGIAVLSGAAIIATVAPNIVSVFGKSGRYRRYVDKKHWSKKAKQLKHRGYIRVMRGGKEDISEVEVTDKGKDYIARHAIGGLKIMPQEQWDRVWRVVVFDIPERKKWAREGIRDCLKRMGFYRMQKSIFIFPYPCWEEIEFLGRLYDVAGYIKFIETKIIRFDDDVIDYFDFGNK